jgi:quercetin dioxygenase-like cupin family protein
MALVTFEPGARTAWHTHPLGQTLIVTFGRGWAQREGGPIEEIRPGDVVVFAPGEKHWHGAAPTTAMTHIAIQEGSTARRSTGWRRSATSSTRAEFPFARSEALVSECDLHHIVS